MTLLDTSEGCAYCEAEIVGPPLTDEEERWWMAGRGQVTVWCSTGCRDNYAERAWNRQQERLAEEGVPDWREDAARWQRLK